MKSYLATRPHPVFLMARRPHRQELEALLNAPWAEIQSFSNDYIGALLPAVGR